MTRRKIYPSDAICQCGHIYYDHGESGCLVREDVFAQLKSFADYCTGFKLDNLRYLESIYERSK